MQVERNVVEPVFEPVTITLQSQAEVDLIVALLGSTNGLIERTFGTGDLYQVFDDLSKYGSESRPVLKAAQLN